MSPYRCHELRYSTQSWAHVVRMWEVSVDDAVMGALSSWWQGVAHEHGPAEAFARLCVQIGQHADTPSATFLADAALAFRPSSRAALGLLERRTPCDERRALWLRYETFLAHAATVDDTADVRERLIELLFELGHAYSALVEVDVALDAVIPDSLTNDAIDAAYQALLEEQTQPDIWEEVERLTLHLPQFDAVELADAAE